MAAYMAAAVHAPDGYRDLRDLRALVPGPHLEGRLSRTVRKALTLDVSPQPDSFSELELAQGAFAEIAAASLDRGIAVA